MLELRYFPFNNIIIIYIFGLNCNCSDVFCVFMFVSLVKFSWFFSSTSVFVDFFSHLYFFIIHTETHDDAMPLLQHFHLTRTVSLRKNSACQIKMISRCRHELKKMHGKHQAHKAKRRLQNSSCSCKKNSSEGDADLVNGEGLEVHSLGHTNTVITGMRWRPGLFSHVLNWLWCQFFLVFVMYIHHLFSMYHILSDGKLHHFVYKSKGEKTTRKTLLWLLLQGWTSTQMKP